MRCARPLPQVALPKARDLASRFTRGESGFQSHARHAPGENSTACTSRRRFHARARLPRAHLCTPAITSVLMLI
eukprot:scaffold82546_cov30-Tisochrysis_lutea.AAC.1